MAQYTAEAVLSTEIGDDITNQNGHGTDEAQSSKDENRGDAIIDTVGEVDDEEVEL